MYSFRFFALVCSVFLVNEANGKVVQIALRENVTMPCPNVNSDLVDPRSFKFTFDPLPQTTHSLTNDQLILTDLNGHKTTLRFPGCYRIKLEFRLRRPLHNPYIETFMRMGTNLPCQTELVEDGAHSLCTNISRPVDWCPQSQNKQLRSMLQGKSTCRFCNLCEKTKQESVQTEQHFISTDSLANEQCKTDKLNQKVEFKMCTPDRKSMHKMNEDNEGKFDEYWKYLKQGVLNVVMHVVDRKAHTTGRRRQCQLMCKTLAKNPSQSVTYRRTLLKTIMSVCEPEDKYITCLYHTMKFDVLDGLE